MRFSFGKMDLRLLASLIAVIYSIGLAHAAPNEVYADKYAAIVIDVNSGKTLFQVNANAKRYPASLTKMMTLYMLFEAMDSGRIGPNTPITVSANAAARPPTKIGFRAGETIGARDAAKALITKSANDVATAIGEYLGGTEANFARMMTDKARQLGMMNTQFRNAHGLPDVKQYTTARDMAILSIALREHFPNQYKLFSTDSFKFRGQTIRGHNRLMRTMAGVDGIKTGYIRMSGFNLATSMRIDNKSLVAVVMGGKTAALRDAHMAQILRNNLPKASRRKTAGVLVAMSRPSPAQLGENVPIPVAKGQFPPAPTQPTVLTAMAAPSRTSSASQAIDQALQDNLPENIDPVITASAVINPQSMREGWAIQIGSLPSQGQAEALLEKAQIAMGNNLNGAQPYTETFDKGNNRFYRARLVGYENKEDAWRACASLKKHNFNCYAIAR